MELDKMDLKMVTERLAELDLEVREMAVAEDVEKATEEKKALLERKAELVDLEKRKQTALGITEGKVEVNVIEERKEQPMEIKTFDRSTEEYRVAWLKNLQGIELNETEKRDYTSAADSSGGAIPTETSEALFNKMTVIAPMLSEITLLRVAGNVQFTAEGVRNAAVQHAENGAITASTDALVKVSLTGYEFNKLLYISKTVQTMSVNAFESWLIDMIAEDIAVAIEDQIINGSGSSAPKGIAKAATWSTASNLVEVTGTATITYGDVLRLIAMLPARYDSNAKFLAGKEMIYRGLANVTDTGGKPILLNDATGKYPMRILGYPVIQSDKTPDDTLFLGDYKKVVGNLSQDVTVERDASAGFASNSVAFRGGAIFDCNIALADAFVKLTTAVYK